MNRRDFLKVAGVGTMLAAVPNLFAADDVKKPNFIVILTDDQGYGDLGCFGSKKNRTPNLDRMAEEGTRFTSFYAQPVCGPSRAALLTGRYPPYIKGGGWRTATEEVTLAEVLKKAGYATCCLGKWDISGRQPIEGEVPNDQGFDEYFGTLGATDSGKVLIYRNKTPGETITDMGSLVKMYTDEAIRFIEKKKDVPFFLYLAHNMPHVKIGASDQFRGKSANELYGDVVEEIDWNVGRIRETLKKTGLDRNTVVIYLSDNGPWCTLEDKFRKEHGGQLATGSPGPLRGGKGSSWEGGNRTPCIWWGPGRIPANRESRALIATLDIMPTLAALAGAKVSSPFSVSGVDQSALVLGATNESARNEFYYYVKGDLHAVRKGKWKLALPGRTRFFMYSADVKPVTSPELYDLESDIGEKTNVAAQNEETVKDLLAVADKARKELAAAEVLIGEKQDGELYNPAKNKRKK